MTRFSVCFITAAATLTACAPTVTDRPLPAPIAAYYTPEELDGLNEKFREAETVLAGKCSPEELDRLRVWLAFMALALEAGDDKERVAELKADTELEAAARQAKANREAISEQCDQAAREASWGFL